MRTFAVAFVVATALLAGCSDGSPADVPSSADDFDDLDVEATATTGVLLGVVVDGAIRPIKDVAVVVIQPGGDELNAKTDSEGRFAFDGLEPGSHLIRASHPSYAPVQSSADVVAGVQDPAIVRVLMERLFSQDPYSELIKFDGYLACSYSAGVTTTCVNDYTRIVGERCTPAPAPPVCTTQCAGGCLRDYNLSQQGGNTREYVSTVGPGWQQIVFEVTWEASADSTSEELSITISYFTRPNTAHFFGNTNGPNPIRLQFDLNKTPEGQQSAEGEPELIGPEGRSDVFTFFNNGGGTVPLTLNQGFRSFQTSFYYGLPPEGWSFVNGDEVPF